MQNHQSECNSVGNSPLSSLGTNYENLSTPMWGLRAWDIDWTLLQCIRVVTKIVSRMACNNLNHAISRFPFNTLWGCKNLQK